MLMGKEYGMQLMDAALMQALNDKLIDAQDAYGYALDKRPFERFTTHASSASSSGS
jgi:Tfp pilus assembly pilus retraction ATPase PilT